MLAKGVKNTWAFGPKTAALVLVLIISGRMFGLFIATPILALHITEISDFSTSSVFWFGIAMGGYGLMQVIFQIPSGVLSDKIGRKPVIIGGLLLFVIGSVICEFAYSLELLALGRLIQGIGAVSAASTALLSDLTPSKERLKWMALMGAGIGLAFTFSFVFASKLYAIFKDFGFFLIPAYIAAVSIMLLSFFPNSLPKNNSEKNKEVENENSGSKKSVVELLKQSNLLFLNIGVFFLHASMVGVFVVIPTVLTHIHNVQLHLQWHFYLLVVPTALFLSLLAIVVLYKKSLSNIGVVLFVLITLISLWLLSVSFDSYTYLAINLGLFFFAFSVLEALQPSMVSKIAHQEHRGSAMGIYHSFQSLGLFAGGLISSFVYNYYGISSVFLFNACMIALWLSFACYSYFIYSPNNEDKQNSNKASST